MSCSRMIPLLLVVSLAAVACGAAPRPAHREPAAVAPVPAPPPAQWLEIDGARMLVTTTRAARGRPDAELPILIVLPWSRSTPAESLAEVGYIDIDAPSRIVAIEGFERDGEAFSWWRRTRPAPEDPGQDDELVQLLTDRAARLAALVETIRRHFNSASPPVVSGISQGGDLSIALGVLHPTVISAALPIASRFPAPMLPAPAEPGAALPPIDAYQGTADRKAPFAPLQHAVAALRDRGYPVVLHAYGDIAHEVSPAQRADVRACAALRLRGRREPCPMRAFVTSTATRDDAEHHTTVRFDRWIMRASFDMLSFVLAACVSTGCSPGENKMKETLTTCDAIAECAANDGKMVTVVGTYRMFPDKPGVDYTGVPRAVRIALADGLGPFLEPYWHKDAGRPDAEIARYLGKKVRVMGRYYRESPRNPEDPPQASAMGGPCIHPVETIELAK